MPAMANITVKKADGTTDLVLTAKTPSAGDKSPAVWAADAISTTRSFRPTFSLLMQSNGPKTARRAAANVVWPVTAVQDGVTVVAHRIPVRFEATLPDGVDDTVNAEAIAAAGNFFVAALIRDSLKSGYAPT